MKIRSFKNPFVFLNQFDFQVRKTFEKKGAEIGPQLP